MTATLENIHKKFERECLLLNHVFDSIAGTGYQARFLQNHLIKEMCVIRLHDAWSKFCRELILSSAGSRPKTSSGIRLTRAPGVNKYNDALTVLQSKYNKNSSWEPIWHNPSRCLDAAKKLQVPNYDVINQGLSLSFDGQHPTAQLTAVRNYFAHRNQNTAQNIVNVARSLFINPTLRAFDLVSAIVLPGTTLFSLWIIRLKTMAQLSIQ